MLWKHSLFGFSLAIILGAILYLNVIANFNWTVFAIAALAAFLGIWQVPLIKAKLAGEISFQIKRSQILSAFLRQIILIGGVILILGSIVFYITQIKMLEDEKTLLRKTAIELIIYFTPGEDGKFKIDDEDKNKLLALLTKENLTNVDSNKFAFIQDIKTKNIIWHSNYAFSDISQERFSKFKQGTFTTFKIDNKLDHDEVRLMSPETIQSNNKTKIHGSGKYIVYTKKIINSPYEYQLVLAKSVKPFEKGRNEINKIIIIILFISFLLVIALGIRNYLILSPLQSRKWDEKKQATTSWLNPFQFDTKYYGGRHLLSTFIIIGLCNLLLGGIVFYYVTQIKMLEDEKTIVSETAIKLITYFNPGEDGKFKIDDEEKNQFFAFLTNENLTNIDSNKFAFIQDIKTKNIIWHSNYAFSDISQERFSKFKQGIFTTFKLDNKLDYDEVQLMSPGTIQGKNKTKIDGSKKYIVYTKKISYSPYNYQFVMAKSAEPFIKGRNEIIKIIIFLLLTADLLVFAVEPFNRHLLFLYLQGKQQKNTKPLINKYWLKRFALFITLILIALTLEAYWWVQHTQQNIGIDSEPPRNLPQSYILKKLKWNLGIASLPKLIRIPAGEFQMGDEHATPIHKVTIKSPFLMSQTEITFEQYDYYIWHLRQSGVADNRYKQTRYPYDEKWGRSNLPVINVSWHEANAYANWLSKQTNRQCRLPSEAEWEYAARAGTTTDYSWGNEIGINNANCGGCSSQWDNKKTAPVGSFSSNNFDLNDMHGNVWEWAEDCYHENYTNADKNGTTWQKPECSSRILRGGSWDLIPNLLHSASRSFSDSDLRFNYVGFRILCSLPFTTELLSLPLLPLPIQ